MNKNDNRFKYKLYFKHDGCTMLLFKNLTWFAAHHRAQCLKQMYKDWQGSFIVTL